MSQVDVNTVHVRDTTLRSIHVHTCEGALHFHKHISDCVLQNGKEGHRELYWMDGWAFVVLKSAHVCAPGIKRL
jgi:hypothetical protein